MHLSHVRHSKDVTAVAPLPRTLAVSAPILPTWPTRSGRSTGPIISGARLSHPCTEAHCPRMVHTFRVEVRPQQVLVRVGVIQQLQSLVVLVETSLANLHVVYYQRRHVLLNESGEALQRRTGRCQLENAGATQLLRVAPGGSVPKNHSWPAYTTGNRRERGHRTGQTA